MERKSKIVVTRRRLYQKWKKSISAFKLKLQKFFKKLFNTVLNTICVLNLIIIIVCLNTAKMPSTNKQLYQDQETNNFADDFKTQKTASWIDFFTNPQSSGLYQHMWSNLPLYELLILVNVPVSWIVLRYFSYWVFAVYTSARRRLQVMQLTFLLTISIISLGLFLFFPQGMCCSICHSLRMFLDSASRGARDDYIDKTLAPVMDRRNEETESHKSAPFSTSNISRYEGEDVFFYGRFLIEATDKYFVDPKSVRWLKNNEFFNTTNRISITVSKDRESLRNFNFISKLTITVIEDDDFANYSCCYYKPRQAHVKQLYDYFYDLESDSDLMDSHHHMFSEDLNSIQECFSEFTLSKMPEKIVNKPVLPGGIAIFETEYATESKPIMQHKLNVDLSCCSLTVYILLRFIFRVRQFPALCIGHSQSWTSFLTTKSVFLPTFRECVCPDMFNIIKKQHISLNRSSQNSDYEYEVDIEYPIHWNLIPDYPFLYKYFWSLEEIDESLWSHPDYMACLQANGTFTNHCKARQKLIDSLVLHAKVNDGLHMVGLILLLAICISAIVFTIKYVFLWLITPVIHLWLNSYVSQDEPKGCQHNVYLTYDVEDAYHMDLAKLLIKYIESHNLTVFDIDRDIPFGYPWTIECGNAIERSDNFILLFSKAFEEEDEKKVELAVIENRVINRKECENKGVFIICTEHCKIRGFYNIPRFEDLEDGQERKSIDEEIISELILWLKKIERRNARSFTNWLSSHGFNWKKAIFILMIMLAFSLERFFPYS